MKRLILLILVLAPIAVWEMARSEHRERSAFPLRPGVNLVRDDGARQVELEVYPKATPEHASQEAKRALDEFVSKWVRSHGVPESWRAPKPLLDQVARINPVTAIDKEYGTVYVQKVTVDVSEHQRARLIGAYDHEVARRRFVILAQVLFFVAICLGVIAGYIRADEATKGYYTNYLRVAAVAGLGAAGAAMYHVLI